MDLVVRTAPAGVNSARATYPLREAIGDDEWFDLVAELPEDYVSALAPA